MIEQICDPKDGTNQTSDFPYYLSQQYKAFFLRAVSKFADYVASHPYRQRIVAIQAMFGSTGDNTPWHGQPVDSTLKISVPQWDNFTRSLAPKICNIYTSRGFKVLWNFDDDAYLTQLMGFCPGSWLKVGEITHALQSNFELDEYETMTPFCNMENIHCRGESWPFEDCGFFYQSPVWNTYWHLMWQLRFGVELLALSDVSLVNPTYRPYYDLFNKYVGSNKPPASNWKGAIIALHDGLDSSDTKRFPENAYYGTATRTNGDRMLKIAQDFASRGAKVEDLKSAISGALVSRCPQKMNDVGWRPWTGNYGNNLITQINPMETSVGWWRVGPSDQPYGRFARSFEYATGRIAFGFAFLNKAIWGGLPFGSNPPTLHLKVIYYDENASPFDIMYDSLSGCKNLGERITPANTKRWVIVERDILDANFSGRCVQIGTATLGSDILFVSQGSMDTIFHGLEIYRVEN